MLNRGKGNVTVTFVTNGGKEIAPVTLEKGEEYTLPEAEKEGLVFADWYYDDGFGSVCPRTITAKKDETLYARYGAVLTFDTAGGSIFDYDELVEWTALGADAKNGFSGVFNGNEYKIRITAKSGTKRNFGIFSKVSGTIYNLSVIGTFSISGSTDATSLGAFAGELTASGKIIDYHSMAEISVAVNPTNKLSVSGAIGTNNGLIDGLIASAGGQINVDGNNEFAIGVTMGTNNGLKWNYLVRLHNKIYGIYG